MNGLRQNKKRPHSNECRTLHSLGKCRNVSIRKIRSECDYLCSSDLEDAAFFSYSSFTSQHFDLRNSLLRRPFFSTHLWASSSVLAFGQSALQAAIKVAVSSFANTWKWLKLNAIPTITNKILINSPLKKCLAFDNLSLLHYYASMYQMKIESTDLFQMLADKTRLRIMRVMVSMPKEEICLCEVTDVLEEPEPNVSRHLKALRQSGLLAAEKEGRWVYHRLVLTDTVRLFYKIVENLPDTEGLFERDLARFKIEIKKRNLARCQKTRATLNSQRKQQRVQYV